MAKTVAVAAGSLLAGHNGRISNINIAEGAGSAASLTLYQGQAAVAANELRVISLPANQTYDRDFEFVNQLQFINGLWLVVTGSLSGTISYS